MRQNRYIDLVDDLRSRAAETQWLEFKVDQEDPKRIGVLISALSNAARIEGRETAYIVWGIEDGTHRVVGTTFDPLSKKVGNQVFELWLRNRLQPAPAFQFREVMHHEGRVVFLKIPAAKMVPTAYNNIPYIRNGSATPKLSDDINRYYMLIEKLRLSEWENGVASSYLLPEDVIELLDYKSYFKLTGQPLPKTQDSIFETLEKEKLIQSDVGGRWNILNLGAILFAKDLGDFDESIQRKAIRVVRYRGSNSAADASNSRDGKRGYALDFEDILEYINGLLPQNEQIDIALRVSNLLFPPTSIRELVANALIHQDMTATGTSPHVQLFKNRIEITNAGNPRVETSRILDQPPWSRNALLAGLMRRMGMCEERGRGMARVFADVEMSCLPAPLLESSDSYMRVVMYGPRSFSKMTKEDRVRACYWHSVVKYKEGERMRNISLCKRLGIDAKNAALASVVIRNTMNDGLIKYADEDKPRLGYLPIWA